MFTYIMPQCNAQQPKYTGNETSFRTATLYSKCQLAKYLIVKQFKPSVNVINVLKVGGGGLWGLCLPGAKGFLLITDKRWSRLEFCVITQHRKFEFGHHRQSKKISNAQELTMQLSQTLSSAIAQIKVSKSPITYHTKRSCFSALLLFFNYCIT